ncbi:HmuY family protein [Flavobacteriaceae bacterium S0825]|uniref:HmuY family protein n=1 Tax=Gaetbulibacter sp. S0825 TaxID=2720084 RepID=UPI00142FD4EF|nr:HmuY family protein [Gaetbulibacter sp. S0825]MCK0108139.1 HmuY family protein [Flavobacteriaceae bacterium S0825]NIX63775.1 hypothetical protein [Gaetbulibacter sp. S0825]
MNKTLKLLSILVITIAFTSCSSDDDDSQPQLQIEAETVSNLYAPQQGGQGQPVSGEFTKFNFSTGTTTTSDTEWDIAFRGTSIIINGGTSSGTTDEAERTGNGGAYITTGTFASVTEVETGSFLQDSETGHVLSNWYTYAGPPTHEISPTPGKILVIRTHDGKYAKVEILSYYQDVQPNAEYNNYRYYTFNYVYQPNQGETSFE